jgi:hypothetical protein
MSGSRVCFSMSSSTCRYDRLRAEFGAMITSMPWTIVKVVCVCHISDICNGRIMEVTCTAACEGQRPCGVTCERIDHNSSAYASPTGMALNLTTADGAMLRRLSSGLHLHATSWDSRRGAIYDLCFCLSGGAPSVLLQQDERR